MLVRFNDFIKVVYIPPEDCEPLKISPQKIRVKKSYPLSENDLSLIIELQIKPRQFTQLKCNKAGANVTTEMLLNGLYYN